MITWEKVGSKFDYGANTSFSNGESLLYLTNANESISGNYSCIANNKVPKASPKTVKLGTFVRVKHKPIFSSGATKVPCDKEQVDVPKCVLSCEARGTPEVSITWLRKGNNLKEDTKYSIMIGHPCNREKRKNFADLEAKLMDYVPGPKYLKQPEWKDNIKSR